jgi:hypothetical protein
MALCHHNRIELSDGTHKPMATAEQLLHEAQYAFQCISFGESRDNTRNRARAKSLSMKIIRKYPATMEAGEAHAILRRLGEEAYTSNLAVRHRHITQAQHHSQKSSSLVNQGPKHVSRESHYAAKALARAKSRTPVPSAGSQYSAGDESVSETLNWGGLLGLLLAMPKAILGIVAFAGIFLFGILGPFLFVPLVLFVMFTGPFRQMLKPEQRKEMNEFVVRFNDYIEQRARGG